MADAFSIKDKNSFVSFEEDMDTGHVAVTIETPDKTLTVTVDAVDLARAAITASPTFTKGVGEIAQSAILTVLNEVQLPDEL